MKKSDICKILSSSKEYKVDNDSFNCLTDHRPLEGVFRKDLYALLNARLMRMREKLSGYTFSVKCIPGKNHQIADALSCAPFFAPEEEEDITIDTALTCLRITQDPVYRVLQQHIDKDYILCTMALWVILQDFL